MTDISNNPELNKIHSSLEEAIVNGMHKDGRIPDGWTYQDHPQMLKKYWEYVLRAYGEEGKDYHKLSEATYEVPENGQIVVYMRGQLLLGLNARANLAEYRKNNELPE